MTMKGIISWILILVVMIMTIVAVAIPDWLLVSDSSDTVKTGLWVMCVRSVCAFYYASSLVRISGSLAIASALTNLLGICYLTMFLCKSQYRTKKIVTYITTYSCISGMCLISSAGLWIVIFIRGFYAVKLYSSVTARLGPGPYMCFAAAGLAFVSGVLSFSLRKNISDEEYGFRSPQIMVEPPQTYPNQNIQTMNLTAGQYSTQTPQATQGQSSFGTYSVPPPSYPVATDYPVTEQNKSSENL